MGGDRFSDKIMRKEIAHNPESAGASGEAGLRISFSIIAALSLAVTFAGAARADDYPNRPITLVVPFPAGGSTTVMARNVADKMSAALGQPIVVENRGGAGGTIGTRYVA